MDCKITFSIKWGSEFSCEDGCFLEGTWTTLFAHFNDGEPFKVYHCYLHPTRAEVERVEELIHIGVIFALSNI